MSSLRSSPLFPVTLALGAVAVAALFPPSLSAQCKELRRINGAGEATNDTFGHAIAQDGDVLVIGAPNTDIGTMTDAGKVYVFHFDGTSWIEDAVLTASDAQASDQFGYAVDVSGPRLAIGSRKHDGVAPDQGMVYVFHFQGSNWVEEAKLSASDGANGDQFGTAVALEGTQLLVGSPLHDQAGVSDRGAVYTYSYRGGFLGWQEESKILLANAASLDRFGERMDIEGSRAVVGVPARGTSDLGSAVVLENPGSGWVVVEEIAAANLQFGDAFGSAVDLDGDTLLVGASGDDTLVSGSGAAYVYHRVSGSFQMQQKLLPPSANLFDGFGSSVAISGHDAVVGVPSSDQQISNAGLLWTFREDQGVWHLDQPLGQILPQSNDALGTSCLLKGSQLLVGAVSDSNQVNSAGSVFEYRVGTFLLESNESTFSSGDLLTLRTSYGTAGTPVWFTSLLVNGSPFFQVLFRLNFGSDHTAGLSSNVPPGMSGLDITLATLKVSSWGRVVQSDPLTLHFQ